MTIEDIVTSVSTMSTEEIKSRLREIRHSRVQSKEVTITKRPTKKAEQKEADLLDMFNGLSEEEKAILLKERIS